MMYGSPWVNGVGDIQMYTLSAVSLHPPKKSASNLPKSASVSLEKITRPHCKTTIPQGGLGKAVGGQWNAGVDGPRMPLGLGQSSLQSVYAHSGLHDPSS